MVVTKITRWKPDTCDCVIELETDFDDVLVPGMNITDPKFMLLNRVCNKHLPLTSTQFKAEHSQMSQHVLDVIERAKSDNLKQVDEQIAKAQQMTKGKARALRELEKSREIVLQFNANLDEEWGELVSFPEAFDSHIRDQIIQEQKQKQEQKKKNG
jgi:hypothetical protein